MKITKYTILTLALASFALADVKIGYVDSNEIMNNFDEVRQVQADLEKEQRRLESEFNELVFGLDSLKQDYDRQRLLMSDTRRNEKENEIANKEKSVQKFQLDKFGPEGEIYRIQNELLKPVLAKIDAAIQKVGSERGYDFILDAMSGALLYALDSHNLTEDVMDELAKATGSVTE
ncbi:MAG TPA: OmpH family outer membrane protein [Candidatus Marinimicrobia bacterium]|jgi:outer membrane protein|uniref:OmpH family outer membrane protein n=1 Tax=marine metagenome TaxID=408172 RepID=A0A381RL37_9ZZZZ|nr:OmpH family outer membrane protein [Candidatus Neomarinimicrobiota bacterium]MDP7464998.1 OmpH family outer membrane protein [Candidatus Neomarinimicrobiota bacterium]HJM84758.1 OmpH family outer membrane protein [Candidatus Neomarinimicrobiota bacterium]